MLHWLFCGDEGETCEVSMNVPRCSCDKSTLSIRKDGVFALLTSSPSDTEDDEDHEDGNSDQESVLSLFWLPFRGEGDERPLRRWDYNYEDTILYPGGWAVAKQAQGRTFLIKLMKEKQAFDIVIGSVEQGSFVVS